MSHDGDEGNEVKASDRSQDRRHGPGSDPAPASRSASDGLPSRPRLIGAPVGLVLVSLLALAVVPLVVHQRIDAYQERRTELLRPARDAVNRVQVLLAQEMTAVREFTIPGAEGFLEREEARAEVVRSLAELAGIAESLDSGIAEELDQFSAYVSDWHDRVDPASRPGPRVDTHSAATDELLYRRTLAGAERLRDALLREEERARRAIERMERIERFTTAGLGFVALAAAGVTLWLGRQRILAWEARRDRGEAERLLEVRSRLMRGLTHDLKNPLGAARGQLRLLQEGILGDGRRRREALSRMDRAIGRAVDLVDDLLQLSRAEAGDLPVELSPVDLAPVLRRTAEEFEGEAEREGVALAIDIPDRLPAVTTDPGRVSDIVRNLLSNGIKYTPSDGEVRLSAAKADEGDREKEETPRGRPPAELVVRVRDTGPGIAPEDLERIFLEFSRLAPGDPEGIGLGLAISREVARVLGGELTVESEPGEGSTFTLALPRGGPPRPRPPAPGLRDRSGSRRRRTGRPSAP